jgi:hypothetical protein
VAVTQRQFVVLDVAAQQMVRRLVIEFDVVERVSQNFDRPDQSGLQVLIKNS